MTPKNRNHTLGWAVNGSGKPKTYRMFVPYEHNDRYFESSHTRDEPKTMSYLMNVLRDDPVYQGVIFLLAGPESELTKIADRAIELAASTGLTRKDIESLAKEFAEKVEKK